ncbi:hypothetical protein AZ54_12345 [Xanthomonas oryzae pv. oryzae PXO86]|nr:hypothetical protein AZ54_12345 [Xanthomonas oryzae pv. oryzae PXO86]
MSRAVGRDEIIRTGVDIVAQGHLGIQAMEGDQLQWGLDVRGKSTNYLFAHFA